ncbi:MAG: YgiQ family radical SAM protein, partial [Nanohaloarchaea archaeon]|nr:YgiQ family radical SAM protein [Candidatus Nanohaloarchaea archaeon]
MIKNLHNNKTIMIKKTGTNFDIIIISAEPYDDHPSSPAGIIAKVLEAKGYSIGIIDTPDWTDDDDFLKLGTPKLCFCITSGSIDSMLNNYTPLKRDRKDDPHAKITRMPDRALIVYCNKIRKLFKESKIVIGGIEASLRRFAHYDYWNNNIRAGILADTRADILVYGNGEIQSIEIAERLKKGKDLDGIEGTCIFSKTVPDNFKLLPSTEEVKDNKKQFIKAQNLFSNSDNLAQPHTNRFILQYRYPEYTTQFLDWIYSLDYSRDLSERSRLKLAQFSVATHRGCIGDCSFCSIALHQGNKIISRSKESIIKEIEKMTTHPDFKGYVDDLGGPSANMYGMDCNTACPKSCMTCKTLDLSHRKAIDLLQATRKIKGIKKIFVRSGIRYDLAIESPDYIKEISDHHVSGCLKIAPEHFSKKVLDLMNKPRDNRFEKFKSQFEKLNKTKRQALKYYFMVAHPGDDITECEALGDKLKDFDNVDSIQIFTPTPMTISTCMYWTGMDPKTLEKVHVPYTYNEKKLLKNEVF